MLLPLIALLGLRAPARAAETAAANFPPADSAGGWRTPTSASHCGIMLGEKHHQLPQGLDQKVFTEKYLPEAFPPDDPRKPQMTLGRLLTMPAGLHGEDSNPGFVNFEPGLAPLIKTPTVILSAAKDLTSLARATRGPSLRSG